MNKKVSMINVKSVVTVLMLFTVTDHIIDRSKKYIEEN